MPSIQTICEPLREIPVIAEADICVLGGSCTGVFAAVRASRLGAKVVIVEKQNAFGGMATSGLVTCWHSLYDTSFENRIIAGLTLETAERLKKRNAIIEKWGSHDFGYIFNSEELKIELDELVTESGIVPYLHTSFTAPYLENGALKAVIVENKSGRGAIRASLFIDATGDGDLAHRLSVPFVVSSHLQPPTMCAKILGTTGIPVGSLAMEHRAEFNLAEDWGWSVQISDQPDIRLHAELHVFDTNCADGDSLTRAEIEGRRQVRATMDIIRKYVKDRKIQLIQLPSSIGIRETRRFKCIYKLTEQDVLTGRHFEDAISYGSYRVDIHHQGTPGITLRYLDGTEQSYKEKGWKKGRWREETKENPVYYQIPYRIMVQENYPNLLLAGRMVDTDAGAYGAIRVMVNTNQLGEAAGVAAFLALHSGKAVRDINIPQLQKTMADGGSILH